MALRIVEKNIFFNEIRDFCLINFGRIPKAVYLMRTFKILKVFVELKKIRIIT